MIPAKEDSSELVLALLQAELQNSKLVSGLEQAGLKTEYFYLGLTKYVLQLIGFSPSQIDDDLYTFYFKKIERSTQIPLNEFLDNLPVITSEIYSSLLYEKSRTS